MPAGRHKKLIDRACELGWQVGAWRAALRAALEAIKRDFPASVMSPGPFSEEVEGILKHTDAFSLRPDLFRVTVEGEAQDWGHPVVVLEFLEVEVTSHLDDHKLGAYEDLWWMFDATDVAHLKVFKMDRFGLISALVTEDTISHLVRDDGKPAKRATNSPEQAGGA